MSEAQRRAFWNRALRRRLADEAAVAKEWPANGRIRPDTLDEYSTRMIARLSDPGFSAKVRKLAPVYARKRHPEM